MVQLHRHPCELTCVPCPARSDLETLVLPLLRMLYGAAGRAPSHLYMLLIILLILTQDASFAANVHKAIVLYNEAMMTAHASSCNEPQI